MKVDPAAVLRGTPLFEGLHRDVAAAVAAQMVRRTYRRGQPLFQQGDPGSALFVVVDGEVAVFVTAETGERMVLTTLGPGDVLGEIALLDEGTRSASAEAVEQTTALLLSRTAFLALLHSQPTLADQLLRTLGALVRRLSEQAADFVFLDLPGRVAKVVLRLAEDAGARDGAPVELAITQTRLAEMVGGSRQSVNEILRNFAGRGMVEVRGRRMVVLRLDLLRRRAGVPE